MLLFSWISIKPVLVIMNVNCHVTFDVLNCGISPDGTTDDGLSVPHVLQWLSGQSHRHLLLAERQAFKIVINFDHTCVERLPNHTICYPIVSACTNTMTIPTAHLVNYADFKDSMTTAIKCGAGFFRI